MPPVPNILGLRPPKIESAEGVLYPSPMGLRPSVIEGGDNPPTVPPPSNGLPPGLRPIPVAAPPPMPEVDMEMKDVAEEQPEVKPAPAVFKTEDGKEV